MTENVVVLLHFLAILLLLIISAVSVLPLLKQEPPWTWTPLRLKASLPFFYSTSSGHPHDHRRATASIINSNKPCPSSTRTTRTSPSWNNLVHMERYHHHHHHDSSSSSICTFLPANRTASFLWNAASERIVEWSGRAILQDMNRQHQQLIEQELSRMIRKDGRPWQMLRSIKGYPQQNVWRRLLEKIHQRLLHINTQPQQSSSSSSQPPPVIHILVLTPELSDRSGGSSIDFAPWQDALQNILNQVFSANDSSSTLVDPKQDDPRQVVFQVQVQSQSTAITTQVYTESIRHGLFHHQGQNAITPPDLILHAMGHADMYYDPSLSDGGDDILQAVNYTDNLRHALQHFTRASLFSAFNDHCQRNRQDAAATSTPPPPLPVPPVVLFLNDYDNNNNGPIKYPQQDEDDANAKSFVLDSFLAQSIYSRVVQQLADYYHVGFLSYSAASGIQRQEWIDAATGATTQGDNNKNNKSKLLTSQARHSIRILWTLLFSMLQNTVDYCSSSSSSSSVDAGAEQTTTTSPPLVPAENLQRIETVIPPYLNGDLSLKNVSPLWKQEEARQRKQEAAACPVSAADHEKETTVDTTNKAEQRGQDTSTSSISSSPSPLCSLALGPPMTAAGWQRKLSALLSSSTTTTTTTIGRRRHLQQQETNSSSEGAIVPGWKVLDNGMLRATETGAPLSLHIPFVGLQQQQQQQQQQRMRAMLFVVRHSVPNSNATTTIIADNPTASAAVEPTPTIILEWSIQTTTSNQTWTRHVNVTTFHHHQGHYHSSSTRTTGVALPDVLEWSMMPSTTVPTTIKLDLRARTSSSTPPTTVAGVVDIAALFICSVDE